MSTDSSVNINATLAEQFEVTLLDVFHRWLVGTNVGTNGSPCGQVVGAHLPVVVG